MNAFFLFAEVYALTMITYAKWIKYETGNGTPETNGTSEPIRNVRSKNGIRQYTWCIDRLNCFPLKRREQHPSLFSFLENFSVLSIHWRFVSRRVRGYNKTRYRLEQRSKIAVCMVALPKVLWFSTAGSALPPKDTGSSWNSRLPDKLELLRYTAAKFRKCLRFSSWENVNLSRIMNS